MKNSSSPLPEKILLSICIDPHIGQVGKLRPGGGKWLGQTQSLPDKSFGAKTFWGRSLTLIILVDFFIKRRGRRKVWGEGKFFIFLHNITTWKQKKKFFFSLNCSSTKPSHTHLFTSLSCCLNATSSYSPPEMAACSKAFLFIFFLAPRTQMFTSCIYVFLCLPFSITLGYKLH